MDTGPMTDRYGTPVRYLNNGPVRYGIPVASGILHIDKLYINYEMFSKILMLLQLKSS